MESDLVGNNLSADDVCWLIENADEVLSGKKVPADLVQRLTQFRNRYGIERGATLSELVELRERGRTKFALADQMFFTRRGLEQATDEVLAAHKAQRFSSHRHIADLCSGIGGDAMGLADELSKHGDGGRLSIVELSAPLLAFSEANILIQQRPSNAKFPRSSVDINPVNEDVLTSDSTAWTAWHFDPDRRPTGARRSDPDAYQPPLPDFLARPNLSEHGAIKLSPAADVDQLLLEGFELEWLGHRRECQQQVAWRGDLAHHASKRVATWIWQDEAGLPMHESLVEDVGDDIRQARSAEQKRFVYEPKPSVLAAGLQETLARKHELEWLTNGASYFVSDELISTQMVSGFQVEATLPFRKKTLRRELQRLGCRVSEVKKRGVDVNPNDLLREFSKAGEWNATLLFYPVGDSVHVIIARRLA